MRRPRRRRAAHLLTTAIVGASPLMLLAGAASVDAKLPQGGWAVTTLDEVPELVAGEPVEIGFTVRQHGQTPVTADIGEVGITLAPVASSVDWTYPRGAPRFFPAEPGDRPGHFVATVTARAAGPHEWGVRQGWFGDQALGVVEVRDGSTSQAGAWPGAARPALLTLGGLLGLVAVIGPRRSTRSDDAVPAPASR